MDVAVLRPQQWRRSAIHVPVVREYDGVDGADFNGAVGNQELARELQLLLQSHRLSGCNRKQQQRHVNCFQLGTNESLPLFLLAVASNSGVHEDSIRTDETCLVRPDEFRKNAEVWLGTRGRK